MKLPSDQGVYHAEIVVTLLLGFQGRMASIHNPSIILVIMPYIVCFSFGIFFGFGFALWIKYCFLDCVLIDDKLHRLDIVEGYGIRGKTEDNPHGRTEGDPRKRRRLQMQWKIELLLAKVSSNFLDHLDPTFCKHILFSLF